MHTAYHILHGTSLQSTTVGGLRINLYINCSWNIQEPVLRRTKTCTYTFLSIILTKTVKFIVCQRFVAEDVCRCIFDCFHHLTDLYTKPRVNPASYIYHTRRPFMLVLIYCCNGAFRDNLQGYISA
jgi:hypothetical protein